MKKYKMIVAYDGTDYQGWQSQLHKETVCDRLESRFAATFGQKISITGASRTDSGVHAIGQTATFRLGMNIDSSRLMQAWNNSLPRDIMIRSLEVASKSFHPLRNVKQKIYYYHIFLRRPLPFVSRFGWHYEFINLIDFEKLQQALELYIGEHDFASFSKVEDKEISTVRKINQISINRLNRYGVLQIVVVGQSFLRFQIRRMLGYAVDVARRREFSVEVIKDMLKNPDPQQELTKAEAQGLCLRKIIYE